MFAEQLGVIRERGVGARKGIWRESSSGVDTFAEPDDAHLAVDVMQHAVAKVGDQ
jgi:hypothetical protein